MSLNSSQHSLLDNCFFLCYKVTAANVREVLKTQHQQPKVLLGKQEPCNGSENESFAVVIVT
jgi:hypothetical protein